MSLEKISTGSARPAAASPDRRAHAGAAWKRALHGVAGAAFRLHHYRFVRARMLQDALSAEYCDPESGPESGDSRG